MILSYPEGGDRFGPGFRLSMAYDGTYLQARHWEALLFNSTSTELLLSRFRHNHDVTGKAFSGIMGLVDDQVVVFPPTPWPPAEEAALQVSLKDTIADTVLETTTISVNWDGQSGIPYFQTLTGQGSGGFTQLDRTDLQIVKASVWRSEGTSGPDALPVVSALIDFIRGPSRAFTFVSGSLLLSGSGTIQPLTAPSGALAYGAQWKFIDVPDGFGLLDGVLPEYHHRMAQFVVWRHGRDGFEYVDELIDANTEDGYVSWKIPAPDRVEYTITPGVIVQWFWLT